MEVGHGVGWLAVVLVVRGGWAAQEVLKWRCGSAVSCKLAVVVGCVGGLRYRRKL